jgi:dephospho-CoA kinase
MRIYLTGPAGAGKTTAAGLLYQDGFAVYRLSDLLRDRSRRRERGWLQAYGDRLRGAFGPAVLAVAAHLAVECDGAKDAVLDGVRLLEEGLYLRGRGYVGIRVVASDEVRRRRLLARDGRGLTDLEALHATEREALACAEAGGDGRGGSAGPGADCVGLPEGPAR